MIASGVWTAGATERDEEIELELLVALAAVASASPVVYTLGGAPRPNRIRDVTPSGIWVETDRTLERESGAQLVAPRMLNLAWDVPASRLRREVVAGLGWRYLVVAYFITTPLGRDVPAGDWMEYRKDQVLQLLYDFARSPFNDGSLLFKLASICNATLLDPAAARDVASALVAGGLADEPVPHSFRITPRGIQFVHSVRSNGRFALAAVVDEKGSPRPAHGATAHGGAEARLGVVCRGAGRREGDQGDARGLGG